MAHFAGDFTALLLAAVVTPSPDVSAERTILARSCLVARSNASAPHGNARSERRLLQGLLPAIREHLR
ncbi:uncharacterized protein TRAVEDRAFT_28032 [Trametes versicolor FP-101664 SS1]|uniref:uncharacterized protein n=1 Tax=Trametes versicolor (strain FP-101664) TaxID=717944 RepID=UPI0004622661|nr:uncharacterized protein TRAVEDRAFT_28032 [Trametes versicolor FP-101664 SS1]EIW60471.1 hypothetical protein TRAVEDRAFT_28032 [Trametes versicolor FP-101664 SS1]